MLHYVLLLQQSGIHVDGAVPVWEIIIGAVTVIGACAIALYRIKRQERSINQAFEAIKDVARSSHAESQVVLAKLETHIDNEKIHQESISAAELRLMFQNVALRQDNMEQRFVRTIGDLAAEFKDHMAEDITQLAGINNKLDKQSERIERLIIMVLDPNKRGRTD